MASVSDRVARGTTPGAPTVRPAWAPEDGPAISGKAETSSSTPQPTARPRLFLARYGPVRKNQARRTDGRLDRSPLIDPGDTCCSASRPGRWSARSTPTARGGARAQTELAVPCRSATRARHCARHYRGRGRQRAWLHWVCYGAPAAGRWPVRWYHPIRSPPRCRATRPTTPPPRPPRAMVLWLARNRRRITGKPRTGCRCSGRSGIAKPSCPPPAVSRRGQAAVHSSALPSEIIGAAIGSDADGSRHSHLDQLTQVTPTGRGRSGVRYAAQ